MGGRGAASGIDKEGFSYGTRYQTVLKHGNIKFVKADAERGVGPFETRTKGRVYVMVNDKNQLKSILYYDNVTGRKYKTIDLTHDHAGMELHVHHGYIHKEYDNAKGATGLSPKEKKMVDRVKELWLNRNRKG